MAWPPASPSLRQKPPSFCARRRRVDAPIWPGELFPASPLPRKSIARRYGWDIFSLCCSKWRFYRQRLQFAAAVRHAPTTRAHRGPRIQAESRASEKKHRGPLAEAPGRFWAARIRRALFPNVTAEFRGMQGVFAGPCGLSRSPAPARGRPAAVRRGPACERP
jgi:hypothetical protein